MKLFVLAALATLCAHFVHAEIINESDPVDEEQFNLITTGSSQKQPLQNAQPVLLYLSQILLDYQRLQLVQYSKQIVSGIRHLLLFKYKNGKNKIFKVFQSLDGKMELQDDGSTSE